MKKNIIKYLLMIFIMDLFFTTHVCAQILDTPLEKNNFTNISAHQELLDYLEALNSTNNLISLNFIGKSVEGREIPIVRFTGTGSEEKATVLLFCQQHGNEPSGKEAALLLIKELAGDSIKELYNNLDIYIIPSLNPDGNEAGKRANANKEDLNRNHLLLTEPEVIALHKVFNNILPDATLDVHEYSAFRKSFKEAGYVRSTAEQFGAPTNLNISRALIHEGVNNLFPFINKKLESNGITFSNYYKMNDPEDTVRASTAGIIDGRQSFAILNTFSFILEGRNGPKLNSDLKRRTYDQLMAIKTFLEFVNNNHSRIKKTVKDEREKLTNSADSIIVQMDYEYSGDSIKLPIQLLPSFQDSIVTMKYSPEIKAIKSVSRPEGYIIPGNYKDIISFLDKHGIEYKVSDASYDYKIEKYKIESISSSWLENKSFKIATVSKQFTNYESKKGDVIVLLNQIHGTMISIAFEPESMWGIVQSEQYEGLLNAGKEYPIYRINNK